LEHWPQITGLQTLMADALDILGEGNGAGLRLVEVLRRSHKEKATSPTGGCERRTGTLQ
jgi:hypothetical protein